MIRVFHAPLGNAGLERTSDRSQHKRSSLWRRIFSPSVPANPRPSDQKSNAPATNWAVPTNIFSASNSMELWSFVRSWTLGLTIPANIAFQRNCFKFLTSPDRFCSSHLVGCSIGISQWNGSTRKAWHLNLDLVFLTVTLSMAEVSIYCSINFSRT